MAVEAPGATHTPFETSLTRPGIEGLQLDKALDQLSPQELSRMSNLFHTGGDLTSRPGQVLLAQTGVTTPCHSLQRLNDPRNTALTRFVGSGTHVYRGTSGLLADWDAGYSGDPLTFATARPSQSGEPWMVIADRTRMSKGNRLGVRLPLGLAAPAAPVVVVPPNTRTKSLCKFESADGTQASAWTGNGFNLGTGGTPGNPVLTDVTGSVGSAVNCATQIGSALTVGYGTILALPKALVMNQFDDASPITDDDIIHLAIRMSNPAAITEIRVYFVVSPFNKDAKPPGIQEVVNNAYYVHAYRPSDYTAFLGYGTTGLGAEQAIRQANLLELFNAQPLDEAGEISTPHFPGANTWIDFGVIGLPVRRGDFLPVGSAGDPGTDWNTVSGILIVIQTNVGNLGVSVAFDDLYVTGGYGPDTSEPDSQKLDYRITNYDPRTGAESNPSPTLAETLWVDALRQAVRITPAAGSGDPNLRQGFYQRGGALTDNWRFVGFNTADGAAFLATLTDATLSTAATLATDHFQPVATVDANGTTVLGQPVPVVLGPMEDGTYLALGDPYRPGHLYASRPGEVDHWPSTGDFAVEVCSPSDELMNGAITGGEAFVFSRLRGYAVHSNLAGGEGITTQPTMVMPGLACRWGIGVGPGGIYYVAYDGIRVTGGQSSDLLSDAIRPLFQRDPSSAAPVVPTNGYYPIDWNTPTAIHLAVHNLDLWFTYQDTQGGRNCLVYSLIWKYWRSYSFALPLAGLLSDPTFGGLRLIFGGHDGNLYTHDGYSDNGTVIQCSGRTGAWTFGDPRNEKSLGDLLVDADLQGATLTLTATVNETDGKAPQTASGTGMDRYLFEPFGTTPAYGRSLMLNFAVPAPTTAPIALRRLGASILPHPPFTLNRATDWEDLTDSGAEGYLWACMVDCDTVGTARTILVEVDLGGALSTAATLTLTAGGRHKQWFSWSAVHAQAVRLRPTDAGEWLLYKVEWLKMPEPPRIAGWDTNWEQIGEGGDRYYTGVDLEIDTFGQVKTVEIYVDQALVSTQTVQASGRRYIHLTLNPPGRGHLFRLVSTDSHPGLLYAHKWYTTPEPSEQTNWNAGYTLWSSLSDKYLKGLVIEADTFGQAKVVEVQVDGVTVQTLAVTHSGRSVKTYTFPQVLGRVYRVIPTDAFPSRLYTLLPIFDEEPYALARWESQLLDLNLPGSGNGSILSADVCLRSTATVTFTIQVYNASGTLVDTLTHTLASTQGLKQKPFVPVQRANKGVLFKLVFQTADLSPTLTLYKEESRLRVMPWGSPQLITYKEFGNDDISTTRAMTSAVGAASRAGGGT